MTATSSSRCILLLPAATLTPAAFLPVVNIWSISALLLPLPVTIW
jgi:hypothetical protein